MTPAAISLLVCIILVILVMAYYWFQLRKKSNLSSTSQPQQQSSKKQEKRKNQDDDPILAKVKPMYKPAEVGHRSGRQKLFLTSKGLRSYETNEFGFPMPARKD